MIRFIYLSVALLSIFINGCSSLSGCPEEESLKQAGVCADPFFINKNTKNIDSISYSEFVRINGRYYSRDEYKKKIEKEKELSQENERIQKEYGSDN